MIVKVVRVVRDVRGVRDARDVRIVAGFARAEVEVAEVQAWRLKPVGWPGIFLLPQAVTNQCHRPRRRRQQLKNISQD